MCGFLRIIRWFKKLHIVLPRKYRPAVFEDMVGQEAVAKALKNAVLSGRIANAYIFAGPRGVGKTSLARILAKALNCPDVEEATPCNSCDICCSIASGTDLDVVEMDGASHRTVEEVRPIIENISYPPTRARYRVYIIDEVHMLSRHAFNSLLKTLEEPPPFVVFIFATTEPNKIPETVRSRCQFFDFALISQMDILKRLSYICREEGLKVGPGVLRRIARFAKGSMRDAISLLDQLVGYGGDEPTLEALQELIGVPSSAAIAAILKALLAYKSDEVAAATERALKRSSAEMLADELLFFIRDALMMRVLKKQDSLLSFTVDEVEPLTETDTAELTTLFANLLEVRNEMRYSVHPSLLLEVALLRLATRDRIVELTQLLEDVRGGRVPIPSNEIAERKREESKASPFPSSDKRTEMDEKFIPIDEDGWSELRHRLFYEVRLQSTRTMLSSSVLKTAEPTRITVGVHPGHISALRGNLALVQIQRDIEAALKKVTGSEIGVKLVPEEALRRRASSRSKEGALSPALRRSLQQVRHLFPGAKLEGVRDVTELRGDNASCESDAAENTEASG